jgi:hypothetical protein
MCYYSEGDIASFDGFEPQHMIAWSGGDDNRPLEMLKTATKIGHNAFRVWKWPNVGPKRKGNSTIDITSLLHRQ